jgi:hypothetical protein
MLFVVLLLVVKLPLLIFTLITSALSAEMLETANIEVTPANAKRGTKAGLPQVSRTAKTSPDVMYSPNIPSKAQVWPLTHVRCCSTMSPGERSTAISELDPSFEVAMHESNSSHKAAPAPAASL